MSTEQQPAPEEHVDWRRVHKVTPVLNAWKVIVALFAVLIWQNTQLLAEVWEDRDTVNWTLVLLIGGGAVLLLLLVLTTYSVLSWRMMRYAVGRDAVFLHSGILFRQQRHARLNRIQAVDVVQPLLARLFGLAQLKIETAGGGGSSVVLAFLKEEEAQRLRREVLDRVADRVTTTPAPPAGGEPAGPGAAPAPAPARPDVERELLTVPTGRLVGSLMLSGSMIALVLVLACLLVAAIIAESFAPLAGVLPGVIGWGTYLWGRFTGGFNFRAAISPDGIRLRYGLLEQRTQTVPPGRIHTVGLKQPLLWRRRGWWRVEVNVAGYGGLENQMEATTGNVLLPVGSRGDALTALWLVLPDLGVADPQAVIDAALEGSGEAAGFTTSPRSARWLDPISWRRNGIQLTESAVLMRSGRLSRALAIVPHERTQSLALSQGPLERRAGIANVVAATVGGSVATTAHHLEQLTALALLGEASERSRAARHRESPEEWMRRVGLLEPAGRPDGGAPDASAPGPGVPVQAPPAGAPVQMPPPAGVPTPAPGRAPAPLPPPAGAPLDPRPAAPPPPAGTPVEGPPHAR
ncbi:putative membrane protein [Georgenia satyanarayanai]|uniref:Putative membrane protein n=1 Tax=Georgenia satyanarayanai TaxID=860221 RepID=A0A2Y9AJB9_9MICO|nr:PH domain-containing protein [Georgenia satyanarayanai]PYF99532.1 putative membrane protein [Georgenia satyanarayanai]SSA42377.1 putative membrane protein [Georgenia satyanarayanai]